LSQTVKDVAGQPISHMKTAVPTVVGVSPKQYISVYQIGVA